MSIDKQKLKALAEPVNRGWFNTGAQGLSMLSSDEKKYVAAASPATVLALLAEIDQLQEHKQHLVDLRETHGFESWTAALVEIDRLKAENEALRKDAERYRFVRNPIGTSSPLAIWNEGKMPLFSDMADAVVDEFMAKEASRD